MYRIGTDPDPGGALNTDSPGSGNPENRYRTGSPVGRYLQKTLDDYVWCVSDGAERDAVVPVPPGQNVSRQEGRPAPHEDGTKPIHSQGDQHLQECSSPGTGTTLPNF